jgi:hypothetical protein
VSEFVLIHSTGQGAAGWDRLVRALAERGSTAHAVELPSDPDLSAADYAALVREQAGAVPAAPVVLAHDWQRHMVRERLGVDPIELPAGHCPNVSQPGRLADLLLEAVAAQQQV